MVGLQSIYIYINIYIYTKYVYIYISSTDWAFAHHVFTRFLFAAASSTPTYLCCEVDSVEQIIRVCPTNPWMSPSFSLWICLVRGVNSYLQTHMIFEVHKWGLPWTWGYPQIIYFNGICHYKPSFLGYPHLWKPHGTPKCVLAGVSSKVPYLSTGAPCPSFLLPAR